MVLVGILGLPTAGLVAADHLFRQADLQQANKSNAQAATAVAYEVSQSYHERLRVFEGLAKIPSLEAGLAEGHRSLLGQALRVALDDGQYCRLDLRVAGIAPVVVSGSRPCWSPPAPSSTAKSGVRSLGVGIASSVAFSGLEESGGLPGQPSASLQAVFPMQSLTSAMIPGANTHTTVVDGTRIVSSSVATLVGKTVAAPASAAMIRAGRPASASVYAPLIHTEVVVAYRPVPGTGLGVFFSVDANVAYAAARHARQVLLAGYLVLVAIGFGLAGSVVVTLRRRDRARDLAAQHYRSLAESTPDGVAIVDEWDRVVYTNPAMLRLTGALTSDTWLGHPLGKWVIRPDVMAMTGEMQLGHADGHRVAVEGNAGPFDFGGRFGTIWVFRDLAQRHAAEAAVALAEARQRVTIETVSDGIVVYELDGDRQPRAVLMNPAAIDLLGHTIDDLQGAFSWVDSAMIDTDGQPVTPDQLPVALVARTGQAHTAVLGVTATGSAQRWLRAAANPVRDEQGKVVGIVTSLVDITNELQDRIKAETDRAHLADLVQRSCESEQALRESEERFHLAFEHAPIGKALIGIDGHYEQVNPAMCRIIGYSEAELQQMRVEDITYPADLAADLAARDRLTTGETLATTFEKRYVTATGAVIWVSKSVSLVRHEDGSPRHFIAQIQDITARKAQEQALAVERRRLYAAQSIGHIGSWETELISGEITWSDTLLELHGLGPDDSPSTVTDAVSLIHPDDRADVERALDACQRTGEAMSARYRVIRADDGTLRWFDAYGEAVYEDGRLVRLAGAVIDVTEQVLTARTASEARDLALEASRQKSAFLATMSHEIRTPMNAVIGMTGLLLDTPLDTEQREFVETVRSSGDTLLGIINDILDFSKIEAGGLQLERLPFDLRDCVDSALDLVSATPNARGLELIGHVDERCPAMVVGDVTRLSQVLVNLMSNAVKFTAHGEVVVSVKPVSSLEDTLTQAGVVGLRFSVTDTGIGIPPDRLSSLFESFSQVDASTTRIYGGTGLGLAISKRLVDAMGGALEVESVTGSGSTFYFSISLGQCGSMRRSLVSELDAPLAGCSALIVDDNPTNRRALRLRLEGWGMAVTEAAGANATMAIVESGNRFDVGIIDMKMPATSRQDLAMALRAAPETSALPIVLLTSHGFRFPSDHNDLLSDPLTKGVRPVRLLQHLQEILSPAVKAASMVSSSSPGTSLRRDTLRVLLAEDNAVNQRLGRLMLEKLGHRVDVVANGREAVEAVRLIPYDAVLMDVEMPEMDGLDATLRIRSTEPPQRQPEIIAMTASALVEDRQACYDAGMDSYLAKPVRIHDLETVLNQAADHLGQRRHRPPPL